ncbi:hypothetical protein ASPZODRAFT_131445 [Penicilliopsis zonata CBS 506.65]|uniref:Enoyl reductase (ER) domain-containing protein n=1 Tax=Penicilliopsis zonata CBS 506.65 TaxID=1073090 RepID=A0A1L9SKT6_9EURO|nr:hypothetical protein ASPZODRAFT_131445 [Penicilliopsis zonata CBS 506.65]OJJ47852.1 hypothetical protein ASPZODRAFT_131445 [Penicilliopsis zonata CBS 506.65]
MAPKEGKVAVCVGTHEICIQQRPIPQPSGTKVLVKIEAAGVCATDLHLVRKSIPYLQPTVEVCGHEGIGRVIGLGPEVDSSEWKVGDRVAHRWLYQTCGECELCLGGNEQFCDKRKLSGKDVDGCWAEYTLVDSRNLLRIPEDVRASEAAPILCAGTTAYRALKTSQLAQGQWVAIVGAGGGLGHLAVQYAKALGLRVLAIDAGESKGELCKQLGAEVFLDFTQVKDMTAEVVSITGGGAHGILVVSSSVRAYEQAVTYVRKLGIIVCIGITPTKMHFPLGPEYFVAKGVRLTGGSTGTIQDTKEALEYVRDGRVKPIIVEKTLEQIQSCLESLEKGDVMGRFVAVF